MQKNLSMITIMSWSPCFQFLFPQPILYLATRVKFQKGKSDMLLPSLKFLIVKIIMSKLPNMITMPLPASVASMLATIGFIV